MEEDYWPDNGIGGKKYNVLEVFVVRPMKMKKTNKGVVFSDKP